jgi:hypothetical protein
MEQSEKKPYEPLKVTDYGDLKKITAAQTTGAIDRGLPGWDAAGRHHVFVTRGRH